MSNFSIKNITGYTGYTEYTNETGHIGSSTRWVAVGKGTNSIAYSSDGIYYMDWIRNKYFFNCWRKSKCR